MAQKVAPTFSFEIPRMVCVADIKAGRDNLTKVIEAIQPARAAIAQAESEMLLIAACDLIENAKGLETVAVRAERTYGHGGEAFIDLSVSCEYTPTEKVEEEIDDELQDVLSEIGEEISNSDLAENSLTSKEFMSKLAVLLLGEEPARSWFAARARTMITEGVKKASN